MIAGLALALVIDLSLSPGIVGVFIGYVAGLACGLYASYVSWPWERGPE